PRSQSTGVGSRTDRVRHAPRRPCARESTAAGGPYFVPTPQPITGRDLGIRGGRRAVLRWDIHPGTLRFLLATGQDLEPPTRGVGGSTMIHRRYLLTVSLVATPLVLPAQARFIPDPMPGVQADRGVGGAQACQLPAASA